jgi:hypothetical protein
MVESCGKNFFPVFHDLFSAGTGTGIPVDTSVTGTTLRIDVPEDYVLSCFYEVC